MLRYHPRRDPVPSFLSVLLACILSAMTSSTSIHAAELTPQPVPLIPAGTVIDQDVPDGWTHIINQSRSRIGTGDLSSVSDTIAHIASFLSSNLLARVETQEIDGRRKHRIGEVAVGLGMEVDGKQTIISSKTLKQQEIQLGFLEKMGLSRAEARLPKLLIVGRSDTIIVFDGVSNILRDGRHVEVMARHAVLVDELSGDLTTYVWFIDLKENGEYVQVFGPIDVLPPSARTELVLNVDSDLFVLGLITERALAVSKRPEGLFQIEFPEWFRPVAAQAKLDGQSLEQIESSLQALLEAAREQARAKASP